MNPIDNVSVNLQEKRLQIGTNGYTYDEVNSELIKIDSIDKKGIIRTFD